MTNDMYIDCRLLCKAFVEKFPSNVQDILARDIDTAVTLTQLAAGSVSSTQISDPSILNWMLQQIREHTIIVTSRPIKTRTEVERSTM